MYVVNSCRQLNHDESRYVDIKILSGAMKYYIIDLKRRCLKVDSLDNYFGRDESCGGGILDG